MSSPTSAHQCDQCSELFETHAAQVKHRKNVHDRYKCASCEQKFPKLENVENHFRNSHLHETGKDFQERIAMWDQATYFNFTETETEGAGKRKTENESNVQNAPMRKMKRFDPCQPSTSKKTEMACCENGIQYHYSAATLKCSGDRDCRIPPGSKYMAEEDGDFRMFCIQCFDKEEEDIEYWREMKNENEKVEPIKECTICRGVWHESCSMTMETPFKCLRCIAKMVGYTIPKVDIRHECPLSNYMTDKLNVFCNIKATRNNGIAVVNFTTKRTVDLVAERPPHLKEQFKRKYGDSPMEYTERVIYVIQRSMATDVIFFSMITHEYENHCGEKYCIIDNLDTIPFFKLKPLRTTDVYHQVMLSYFDFMRRVGYTKAHFWAQAPAQGDDMMFICHPATQIYLNQEGLEGWYVKMLEKGTICGIFENWKDFNGFKQSVEAKLTRKRGKKTGIRPSDIPIFKGSLFADLIRPYPDDDPEENVENQEPQSKKSKHRKLSPANKFDLSFPTELQTQVTNNYWIDLKVPVKLMSRPSKCYSHEHLGDKNAFLEKCVENNWEFSTRKRAEFATRGIIEEINRNSVVAE